MRGQKDVLPRNKWDALEYYLAQGGDIPRGCEEYVGLFSTAEAILRELSRENLPIGSNLLAELIGSDTTTVEHLFAIFLSRSWVTNCGDLWSLEERGWDLAAAIMQSNQGKTAITFLSTLPHNQPPLAFPS